jgi:hypothetical protein
MTKLLTIFLVLLQIVVTHHNAICGGWTQPKGGGFAKLDAYIINAGNIFGDDGKVSGIPDYSFISSNIYAEAGITNKLTGIVYFPFYVNSTSDPVGGFDKQSISGIGDLDIGGRYNLVAAESYVVSAVLILGIPTGSANDNEILWTGDGEFNQIFKAEAGFSFSNSIYTVVGFGFNNRSEGFSDELNYDMEAGISVFDNSLIISLKSNGRFPLDNGNDEVTGGYGMFSNNTGYASLGPEITYFLKNGIGFSVNTYGAFYGRNLIAAPSYSVGIVYKHKVKN